MNSSIARNVLTSLLIAIAIPCPQAAAESYVPVKTLKEAKAIQPGDRIAIQCGNCGAFSTITADGSRSYLHGFTCKTCGLTFKSISVANGGSIGAFVYSDGAGHQSKLFRAK